MQLSNASVRMRLSEPRLRVGLSSQRSSYFVETDGAPMYAWMFKAGRARSAQSSRYNCSRVVLTSFCICLTLQKACATARETFSRSLPPLVTARAALDIYGAKTACLCNGQLAIIGRHKRRAQHHLRRRDVEEIQTADEEFRCVQPR